jgi:hypothetical protein
VVGDWDGNGTTTVGVIDPGGTWYTRNENSAGVPDAGQFGYGLGTWQPVAGMWSLPAHSPAAAQGSALDPMLTADPAQAALPAGARRARALDALFNGAG